MKVLFIGDVFGRVGREISFKLVPLIIKKHNINLVIANVENICHGKGTRQKDIDFMREIGVHVFTGGNHSFNQKEIFNILKNNSYVIVPANYPQLDIKYGYSIYKKVLVINLQGRVFMKEGLDSPFKVVDEILEKNKNKKLEGIIVDFHAETTSEKNALYNYLNGRVSAIIGTHTHIQTADEKISINGTAIITDVGMTGPEDSIIGMNKDIVLNRFLSAMPAKFEPAEKSPIFSAVVLDIDRMKCIYIKRILIRE